MATQQLFLFGSNLEGSSVYIVYDDVTFIATGLVATCPQTANSDLVVAYQLPLVNLPNATPPTQQVAFVPATAIPTQWHVTRGSAVITTTFNIPLQGFPSPVDGLPDFTQVASFYFSHNGPVVTGSVGHAI